MNRRFKATRGLNILADGADTPTIPLQPFPRDVMVLHDRGATYISRTWDGEDWKLCRLCPRRLCTVSPAGNCLVVIRRDIPDSEVSFAPRDVPDPDLPPKFPGR